MPMRNDLLAERSHEQKTARNKNAEDGAGRAPQPVLVRGGRAVPGQPAHRPGLGFPGPRPTPRPRRLVRSTPRRGARGRRHPHPHRRLGRPLAPATQGYQCLGRIRGRRPSTRAGETAAPAAALPAHHRAHPVAPGRPRRSVPEIPRARRGSPKPALSGQDGPVPVWERISNGRCKSYCATGSAIVATPRCTRPERAVKTVRRR